MINQFEMSGYLHEAVPELDIVLISADKNNPYTVMHKLLDLTSKKIREHNYTTVKRCFEVADKLYDKGNGIIKNAVENIYVYSLTNLLYINGNDKKKLLAIIPMTLYTLYINQVYHKGC